MPTATTITCRSLTPLRFTFTARITVKAEGTAPIDRIYLLRNSQVIYAQPGGDLSARFEYVDNSPGWKGSFYYVRVEQKDGKQAISSPVWVD